MREALQRLYALPPSRKHRQWEAIVADAIVLVGSFTRTTDAVSPADLAAHHGVSQRTVHRAMQWAHQNGVVIWWKWRGLRRVTLDSSAGHLSSDLDSSAANLSTSEETENRGRVGRPLIDVLAGLMATVNEDQADRIRKSPEVRNAARGAAGRGRTVADVRRAWDEQEVKTVGYGPAFAVTLLQRVAEGKSLPQKSRQRQQRRTNTAARPPEAFGKSGRLPRWGYDDQPHETVAGGR